MIVMMRFTPSFQLLQEDLQTFLSFERNHRLDQDVTCFAPRFPPGRKQGTTELSKPATWNFIGHTDFNFSEEPERQPSDQVWLMPFLRVDSR